MSTTKLESSITCCNCGKLFAPARIMRDSNDNKLCAPCYRWVYQTTGGEGAPRPFNLPQAVPVEYPHKTWC